MIPGHGLGRRYILLLTALGAVAALLAMLALDDRNRVAWMGDATLREGESLFGVVIGMEASVAERSMTRAGFEETFTDAENRRLYDSCGEVRIQPGDTLRTYHDASWRSGAACLIMRDGKVLALSANYVLLY